MRLLAVLALALTLLLTGAGTLLTSGGDWPTYLHDPLRSAASPDESTLSPANAPQLVVRWSFKTGRQVAASPTVAGGTVYIGSWDGFEYAFDAATGTLKWRTYLGSTSSNLCSSALYQTGLGVTSAATVQNGVVYLGGGDSYWYALAAAGGAVQWKVYTGDNSPSGGHYNWSSPLLYNGSAYIGVASLADCPVVQGQLLQVDLSTHQIVHTFNVVPAGQVGGGIWTSPSVDAATNTIYVTSGTKRGSTQTLSQAMLALDATTLALKGAWQLPAAQTVPDSDWGTSPTLFNDVNGRPLVAAINKNGVLYAFDRTNVSAGPLWRQQVAAGGTSPLNGYGSVSSGAFGAGRLYMAGGRTTINTVPYSGSVRAFDPATGHILWEHGTSQPVIAALAYANGLVVAGAGSTLQVLDAATGAVLYSYRTGGTIYGAPTIANGQIFIGSVDGKVYSFGLPVSGTRTGTIATAGGADSYTFRPSASGSASIGTCALATSNNYDLSVYDSSGNKLAGSTSTSNCEWVSISVSAGQTYTVQTLAVSGTGMYRSSWNVNGAPVVWLASGSIGTSGGTQYYNFPTLSANPIALSTCGPSGTDFDLFLLDATYHALASSTSPSNCESLTYTPGYRGLFRLQEVSYSGTGAWLGTVATK